MKTKLFRNVLICVCLMLCILAGIYLALGFYYQKVFVMNTWVNGVYCTGKTPEEVNKELLQEADAPFLTIQDKNGDSYEIASKDIGFTMDYTAGLQELFQKQHSFYWLECFLSRRRVQVAPEIRYDAELLKAAVSRLEFVKKEEENPKELKIIMTEEGYALHDTMKDRLDEEAVHALLVEKLEDDDFIQVGLVEGVLLINLYEGQCYADVEPDEAQLKVLEQWQTLERYIDSGIVYDMGDELIPLAGKIASSFIAVDENGEIYFDQYGQPVIKESAIEMFVNSLADAYNTYKKELTFISTAGEVKTVPYVNYGTEIDVEKEIAYLTAAFAGKCQETHIPGYIHEGYVRGKNDIGNSYIEIDMGNQKLYAYLDGKRIVDTDIVTGNVKNKWSTPEGVVYVYNKQRNRTLRGKGYASFVKYWMPVKGGIGLHDASWRKNFGGEIYKTDGSHGCINIPKAVMPDIYENFEVGTPVIMFY